MRLGNFRYYSYRFTYDKIGPIINERYKEQVSKRMEVGQNMRILSIYTSSAFQDFERFLRTEIDLVEDDTRLVIDKYKSSFINYELQSSIYTFKDISEALFNILQHEHPASSCEIVVEFDDITKKINWL